MSNLSRGRGVSTGENVDSGWCLVLDTSTDFIGIAVGDWSEIGTGAGFQSIVLWDILKLYIRAWEIGIVHHLTENDKSAQCENVCQKADNGADVINIRF